jgi:hypothetical protein
MHSMPAGAKFCGNCGSRTFSRHVAPGPVNAHPPDTVPGFAHAKTSHDIPEELQKELAELFVLLARERLFLYFQCLVFLAINAFGLWLSFKVHAGYNGDEVTNFVMSLTPTMFINSIGLVVLSPIFGTKREIAKLKQRLLFVRHRIEYLNLS